MAQTIKLKRSSVEGRVPTTSDLELGEIAINTYDGKAYIKKNDGTESIVSLGSGDSYTQTESDARFVNVDGDTMTGFLTLHADPTNAFHAATKEYVDTVASASLHYHLPVRLESPIALNAAYNNGTNGVGATLTNSGTNQALVIDGVSVSLNDRVLVYRQANAAHNGVYIVTTVGDGSTAWVLTRATDADSYSPSDPDSLGQGDAFYVQEGNTGAGELYVMNTEGTVAFGTTAINFVQISSAQIYSAGSGLSLTGTQFAHADTSSQSSINNSNGIVIQDITLDQFGHITSIGSVNLDGRYYTQAASDARYTQPGDNLSTFTNDLWEITTTVPTSGTGKPAGYVWYVV